MARAAALRLEDRFLSAFSRLGEASTNGKSAHLAALRKEGLDCFAVQGFPKPRTEAWKYTNLRSVLRRPIPLESGIAAGTAPVAIPGLDAHVVVLVDGRFSREHSRIGDLPEGTVVSGLAEACHTHNEVVRRHLSRYAPIDGCPFVALNTAGLADGAFIYLPRGVQLDRPVHLVHLIASAAFLQPRTLVVAGAESLLELVQSAEIRDANPAFVNAVTEVCVESHARLELVEVQTLPATVTTVNSLHANQKAGSHFGSHTFTFDGEIVRNNVVITANAEHCETKLNGLFLACGTTHVDNHTLVDHAKPDCYSSELYKGILNDRATGVFNGKVLVRQDAQRINAYQSSKAVVLTDTARMYAKPELEIYADDVKCSHGATTGQLDKDALFYLRARGLTPQQARAVLLESFSRELFEPIRLPPLRQHLEHLVAAWLGRS